MRNITNITKSIGLSCMLLLSGCNVDASYYSEITPKDFYVSQESVYQRFYRPFTHWRYGVADSYKPYWTLQELGTDEFCIPTRGSDWLNSGVYQRAHHHKWTYTWDHLFDAWESYGAGIAYTIDVMESFDEYVDFDALGFPTGTKDAMMMQLQVLAASFYKTGLDFFGGVPIYTTTVSGTPLAPRSTDVQTFEHAEKLLKDAIPNLPKKVKLGAMENGSINQATGAALLAQLYFNAEPYARKNMYAECAKICEDILSGVYGTYELENDWTAIFGFKNEYSTEILWSAPSEYALSEIGGSVNTMMQHYNIKNFMGGANQSGNNGGCLVPSLKPDGTPYDYKLGSAYSKFEDTDIRKQQYIYAGKGEYKGMFFVGRLENPIDGGQCIGSKEYKGEVITMVDQIACFKKVGKDYATVNDLPSDISTAEENSGVRIMKRTPMPNATDIAYSYKPDIPIIRLAEIYYMLAECKLRAGEKAEAAKLINTVRKRYFVGGNDPNPVTEANLDKYRMLDEWMIEFVGEARRRTDLIRWDAYVTEDWWDHKASNDKNLNRFPIPEKGLKANNSVKQNPGY